MKKTMTMFNVDFGESILISDFGEYNNLLIDYGSEFDTNIRYIASKLNSIKNVEALITHFHDDHINGFIDLAKVQAKLFKKVYIPNIFSTYNNYNVNDITLVEMDVILFFLLNYKFNSGNLSLFEFLVAISDSNADLCLLQRGDTFISAGTEYITLWPNISKIKFMRKSTQKELISFLCILEQELDNQINLNNEIKKISSLLSQAFLKRKNTFEKINLSDEIDVLRLSIESLAKAARALNKNGIGNKRRMELDKWIAKLKGDANKVSIVFQNKINTIGSNILMTGDIDNCRLRWILKDIVNPSIKVHKRFNIIKAPHHGTKTYFIDYLPISRNIIISNGATNNVKRGKISSSYLEYVQRGTRLNCTNTYINRCEVLMSGQVCKRKYNCYRGIEVKIFFCDEIISCLKQFLISKRNLKIRKYRRTYNLSRFRGRKILNMRCTCIA